PCGGSERGYVPPEFGGMVFAEGAIVLQELSTRDSQVLSPRFSTVARNWQLRLALHGEWNAFIRVRGSANDSVLKQDAVKALIGVVNVSLKTESAFGGVDFCWRGSHIALPFAFQVPLDRIEVELDHIWSSRVADECLPIAFQPPVI